MNSSMINAMVSMNGLQQKLDILADNIANVNTVGYKRKEGSFEDLLTTLKKQPDSFTQPGRLTPLGFNQGWGSRLTNVQPDLSQGPLQQTDQPYDLAIEGNALFEVLVDNNGTRAYTRGGSFQTSFAANGANILTTREGYPVASADGRRIEIPAGVHDVQIDAQGHITGSPPYGGRIDLGQLGMVQATKPGLLSQVSDNLFTIADGMNTGDVVQSIVPSEANRISIHQGYVEQSNVTLADEMTELINVQRAYQLSARALSSSDTMLGLANNLRG
ncbi:flagellar hook-basal body protein [Paenibacillus solisilvae]|uniref:Flagellar hook-basal body protein n=1 Tax=Paenibacillus solisilvae TaxID=2486751 RepID=A0ABW0W4K6_9BACL